MFGWLIDRLITYLERRWDEHVKKVMADSLARLCPDELEVSEPPRG